MAEYEANQRKFLKKADTWVDEELAEGGGRFLRGVGEVGESLAMGSCGQTGALSHAADGGGGEEEGEGEEQEEGEGDSHSVQAVSKAMK